MSHLSDPIYHDSDKARQHLESIRWPEGAICPHCGVVDNATELKGKAHRPGVYKCKDCLKQFSVTVGTVFERSKVPPNKWLLATHLMTSSRKGISAHQIHRSLGVTYKTAWYLRHRIRHAMESTDTTPMGSGGGTVEADETCIGMRKGVKKGHGGNGHKLKVFSLVERGGRVKSSRTSGNMFQGVKDGLKAVSPDANLTTDEASKYRNVGKDFASHIALNHSIKEYVRGSAHTNMIESYFSIFKRGMKGVYQHYDEGYLHGGLAEFDFRYNHRTALKVSDADRANAALLAIEGKRLIYRRPLIPYS